MKIQELENELNISRANIRFMKKRDCLILNEKKTATGITAMMILLY